MKRGEISITKGGITTGNFGEGTVHWFTKVPKTRWIKLPEIYYLIVLEARRPKSRCQQGHALCQLQVRIFPCFF
jgi:hypothetical protein